MRQPERRAWFRLAETWGCCVREAQARCTSGEFAEWVAYYHLQPPAIERIEFMLARLTERVHNLWSQTKLPLQSFMPKWGARHESQETPEELQARIMGHFRMLKNIGKKRHGNKHRSDKH